MRHRLFLLFPLFFCLGISLSAWADSPFQLEDVRRNQKAGTAEYRIRYAAPSSVRPAGSPAPPFLVGPLDPSDDDLLPFTLPTETSGAEQTRGILLAIPEGFTADNAGVTAIGLPTGEAVPGAIETRTVRILGVPALHLIVHRDRLGSSNHQADLIVTLNTVEPAGTPDSVRHKVKWPALLSPALFLNPGEISAPARSSAASRDDPSYPLPAPGDFRVTYEGGDEILRVPLSAVGASPATAATLRIVHHGSLLPVGGVLGDDMWFYAPRRHTLTDNNDSVFITPDAADPSPPMNAGDAYTALSPQGTSEIPIRRERVYTERHRYERSAPTPVRERFFRHHVRRPAGGGFSTTENMLLGVYDDIVDPNVRLSIELVGLTETIGQDPDHFAEFTLAGVVLPQVSWKGRTVTTQTLELQLASLPNPAEIELVHHIPAVLPSGSADRQNLSRVHLAWQGHPRLAADGALRLDVFAGPAPRLVTIGGLPAGTGSGDLFLLDITDPTSPVRLTGFTIFTGGDGNPAVEFEVPAGARAYHLQLISAISSPDEVVTAEQLPDPLPLEARRIYVRHPELAAALVPLIQHRGADSTVELDPQAAYNVHNGGQQAPEALRAALADIVTAAPSNEMPPAVLLVGHGSLDARDYLGERNGPFVEPFARDTAPTSGGVDIEMPVDYHFAIVDTESELPAMRVGRLLVRTPAEIGTIVDRILAHAQQVDEWRDATRPGLFINDNDPFIAADASFWPSIWQGTGHPAIQYDLPFPTPPATSLSPAQIQTIRDDIHAHMEQADGGMEYILYTGHGNIDRWAGEGIVTLADLPNIDTSASLPIIATFTCLNGYYAFPGVYTCLSAGWLLEEGRGAVANIAPSGVEFYGEQRLFSEEILRQLARPSAERPPDIGGVFLAAQLEFAVKYPSILRAVHAFHLFGDPETPLALSIDTETSVSGWVLYGE